LTNATVSETTMLCSVCRSRVEAENRRAQQSFPPVVLASTSSLLGRIRYLDHAEAVSLSNEMRRLLHHNGVVWPFNRLYLVADHGEAATYEDQKNDRKVILYRNKEGELCEVC
jgi:hypothetical protein